jgi:hypothetical protein
MPSCEPLWQAAAACWESRQRRERAAAAGGGGRKGWRGKSGLVFPSRACPKVLCHSCDTAVLVVPPWRVTLGRQCIFTASLLNASSVALLDHA